MTRSCPRCRRSTGSSAGIPRSYARSTSVTVSDTRVRRTCGRSLHIHARVWHRDLAPPVPALGLHPGADPLAVARAERLTGVSRREPVDVGEVVVVPDRDDPAEQALVAVPALLGA